MSQIDYGRTVEVTGYDSEGNVRHMVVSKRTGRPIDDHFSRGPDFSKANTIVMVREESIPSEVFSNPGYAIAFANRFANQWGKEYGGTISRDQVTQTASHYGGSVGLGGSSGRSGLSLPFNFKVSGGRSDYTKTSTVAKRDVIYAVTKDILTRKDWTPEQKRERLEKLNTELLRGDFFNPNRLPTEKDMMDKAELGREQTPFSGKYETKEERERHIKNFANKLDQPIIIRPDYTPGDDET